MVEWIFYDIVVRIGLLVFYTPITDKVKIPLLVEYSFQFPPPFNTNHLPILKGDSSSVFLFVPYSSNGRVGGDLKGWVGNNSRGPPTVYRDSPGGGRKDPRRGGRAEQAV